MEVEGIRQHLWLTQHPNNQHKILKPQALHVLTTNALNTFFVKVGFIEGSHKLLGFIAQTCGKQEVGVYEDT
jgi:hypothetical protein